VTAGITAYYMFRLLFVTFFGYRGNVDPRLGLRHPELAGTSGPPAPCRRRRAAPRTRRLADERAGRDPDGAHGPDRLARRRRREQPVATFFARLLRHYAVPSTTARRL
jgi:hypothetical protein